MIDPTDLCLLAFKAERAASRKLARQTGMSMEDALRVTLDKVAAPCGIDSLLATRRATQAREQQRLKERQDRLALARLSRSSRHHDTTSTWQGWFDGSAHPNPGRCAIGALLVGPAGERMEISQAAGHGNSSEAEYRALVVVLEAAVAAGAHNLALYGDSRVVIDDVNGTDASAAPSLRALRLAARDLIGRIDGATVRWLPRHKNTEADALSQRGMAEWVGAACTGA
ncbi:ribonuclease HI family protein [Massilia sp. PAMC28688]|uniref:ribonuclease HI family protein n=1 Tax=Massilia sp. PAMC28688 TaxID=2861283 RepID=UPI001C63511A|nr:ribonuclease HI family protein [Massilia sp. PAMC28688]QYF93373.1 ribonuclease HI family protein [Massilia sp. PAMC28688]